MREVYNREVLGIKTIDDSAFEKLNKNVRKHKYKVSVETDQGIQVQEKTNKFISNIVNYDILSNQRYAEAFFYTPLD